MTDVLRQLRRVALRCAGQTLSDAQLLEAFLARRDEAAFEALLRRHGPMVLGVCRRVLRDHHDAEDACQATFLVLARKAGAVRSRHVVGSWLYGVAYRTSLKARAMRSKRRRKEKLAEPRHEVNADRANEELLERLDAELQRLPEKLRVAVVLCELEGKSRREAARLLGLPEGTLSWRLAQARKRLARRLAPYTGGVATAFSAGVTRAALSPGLVSATAKAAAGGTLVAGVVSAEVLALTEGVLRAMLVSKLKIVGVVALVAALGVPAGLTYSQSQSPFGLPKGASPRPVARDTAGPTPAADEVEALRLEMEALRREVRALRGRVKALEQAPRGQAEAATPYPGMKVGQRQPGQRYPDPALGRPRSNTPANAMPADTPLRRFGRARTDPLDQAEAALQKLRANPDDAEAADALEGALQRLKQRANPLQQQGQLRRQ
jgi:RNA polymerase sigma factor (sigma-70 family)